MARIVNDSHSCAVGHLRGVTGKASLKGVPDISDFTFVTAVTNQRNEKAGASKALIAAGFQAVAKAHSLFGDGLTFWVRNNRPVQPAAPRRRTTARAR